MEKEKKEQVFALCVENKDCEDLEKRKIYKVLPDEEAEKEGSLLPVPSRADSRSGTIRSSRRAFGPQLSAAWAVNNERITHA
jgi:hypothetical protein